MVPQIRRNHFRDKPRFKGSYYIEEFFYSDKDYKRVDAVMKNYGCNNYTLYDFIDKCIHNFVAKS